MYSADLIHNNVKHLIHKIDAHSLFSCLNSFSKMQTFMKYDVFTCWDCMCLIKDLYGKLVCNQVPWVPPKDAFSASLLCHIIGEEETDLAFDGKTYLSHFEIYIAAMQRAEADTTPIIDFMNRINAQESVEQALAKCGIEPFVQRYVNTTFSFFSLDVHQVAAAFAFGREALAPNLFSSLLQHLQQQQYFDQHEKLSELIYFCNRHIELDGSSHFPKMLTMLNNLCGQDKKKWTEVEKVAITSIQAKIDFYHDMQQAITYEQPTMVN